MARADFVWVAALWTRSSFWRKSSRNLGSMAKISRSNCSMWALGFRKGAFCHLSFALFTWIRSTNAAKLMSVPRLGIAKLVVCYFVVYMNWINKCRQADECAAIENCKISPLLFADDLILLSSTESGLQRILNSFADACNTAGMKISTAKIEVLHLSRNPD